MRVGKGEGVETVPRAVLSHGGRFIQPTTKMSSIAAQFVQQGKKVWNQQFLVSHITEGSSRLLSRCH